MKNQNIINFIIISILILNIIISTYSQKILYKIDRQIDTFLSLAVCEKCSDNMNQYLNKLFN
jgi:cell shape-determining protein MreC